MTIIIKGADGQNAEGGAIFGHTICSAANRRIEVCGTADEALAVVERDEGWHKICTLLPAGVQPQETPREVVHEALAQRHARPGLQRGLLVPKHFCT